VPYLKFSRDKRGYEHFSIIEPGTARRGRPPRPRLLFWFRTPPQVKVGRLPFTDDVRRAIEAQNPGLRFDWPQLLATPIPPPDAEHWRERRRIEKAAKQAAKEAASEEVPQIQEVDAVHEVDGVREVHKERDLHEDPEALTDHDASQDPEAAEDAPDQAETPVQASELREPVIAAPTAASAERPAGGRRRRRRGRRRPRPAGETAAAEPAPTVPVPPTEEV
jgi:hypothetical protein